MKYHFKIHREGKGFWAQCIELKGCITEGDSKDELYENMQDALNLFVQEADDSKDFAAFPSKSIKKGKNIVEVALDPQIAFSFMVRYYRLQQGLTQKQAASKLGFENIYSYQRLESKNCNPSLKIVSRLKQLFPELSLDLAVG